MFESQTDTFFKELNRCQNVIILAGAGMSVDSGLPDYRGDDGFWKKYQPFRYQNISLSSVSNPYFFKKDPNVFWSFFAHRAELYRQTTPHNGYSLLLNFLIQNRKRHFVITSNIDGHFLKSGFDKNFIYEFHGGIRNIQCSKCGLIQPFSKIPVVDLNHLEQTSAPKCISCASMCRPNILMFNDDEWNESIAIEQRKAFKNFLSMSSGKTMIIEIGAGTNVPAIRNFGDDLAFELDTKIWRVNPSNEDVAGVNYLEMTAKEFCNLLSYYL